MQSLNIYFTGLNQVEVRSQPVDAPAGDQVLVRAEASLISAGTEGICLSRKFDPGSHRDRWVQYPFSPGYSLVGVVEQIGPQVQNLRADDRVALRTPWSAEAMAQLFFTYLQRGNMRVADLITHHFAPTEAPAAYQLLREAPATTMGVLFDWTQL